MDEDHKRVILVTLQKDINELSLLVKSLDYDIVHVFFQLRNKPDVSSFIGSGKLEEIKKFIDEYEGRIDLVVFNGTLKPSQWFFLEKELDIEVVDRIRLILTIFKDRAKRKEAHLQVRLAELQYEKPFVKELIHRARSGEHPGLMAGGEYQVDDYYEMIKKQMKLIRNDLKKIEQGREIRRQRRYISGYYLVSLAGYTNAGKSSLLHLLTDEKVIIENRLFSTLSTLTRKMKVQQLPILITDTVGFIQSLPAWIINAFHSTLEEIEYADLVILVVDGSESISDLKQKLDTSLKELSDLHVENPILIAVNKIDLLTDDEVENRKSFILSHYHFSEKSIALVSATKNTGLDRLIETIYDNLPNLLQVKMILPNKESVHAFISWLYNKTHVMQIKYDNEILLHIKCNQKLYNKIISECKKQGGYLLDS